MKFTEADDRGVVVVEDGPDITLCAAGMFLAGLPVLRQKKGFLHVDVTDLCSDGARAIAAVMEECGAHAAESLGVAVDPFDYDADGRRVARVVVDESTEGWTSEDHPMKQHPDTWEGHVVVLKVTPRAMVVGETAFVNFVATQILLTRGERRR